MADMTDSENWSIFITESVKGVVQVNSINLSEGSTFLKSHFKPLVMLLRLLCMSLFFSGANAGLNCMVAPGNLKQIDAGNGDVYGVNDDGNIYRWNVNNWEQVPGQLMHVTAGPAGVWGVNKANTIFKLQEGTWMAVTGLLKQVDAGGNQFLAGVNGLDMIYCLNQMYTNSKSSVTPFTYIDGSLKYYSCGPLGCWGVNSGNNIYYRYSTTLSACQGSNWKYIEGSLVMVEVGTDGSVYGVSPEGNVYTRMGIDAKNPIGTTWEQLDFCSNFKHVTYDAGTLWLLTKKGDIFKCTVTGSPVPTKLS
ncbi:fish-egg lectin-like [Bombina bombina]|uniref:fish-egg lectin-like n=1 Tax=Bombina bombina TaxID=8345 RepID=UPI00235AC3D9|nr:fish-egg lectin-like [Bombina bombina]